MFYKDLPRDLLEKVEPQAVQQYAVARGWVVVPMPNSPLRLLRYASGEDVREIAAPTHPGYRDYAQRVADAVQQFAEQERKDSFAILNTMLHPSADVLRVSLAGEATADGSVPLGDGICLLRGARKALMSAACNVLDPQPYYSRLSRGQAEVYVNHCRMGQTDYGSFVATVMCPTDIPDEDGQLDLHEYFDLEPIPTFARKVTTKFMEALVALHESIDDDGRMAVLHSVAVERGVSANLCEALLEMRPERGQYELALECEWFTPPTKPLPEKVRLRDEHFSAIRAVAQHLRPHVEPVADRFVGEVDSLSGEPDRDGRMQGTVTLKVIGEDELLRAKVVLGPDDYQVACDAHKDHQPVSLTAILQRGNRVHTLTEYRDFKRVP